MDTATVPQKTTNSAALPPPDNRSHEKRRTAVGYVRVSTSMQAEDGLSLDAQRAAITAYCNTHDLRLIRIFEDVESGARSDRRGLQNALAAKSNIFLVLKFDRLSRSIKHFCQLYEDYFSQSVELVAIREAIRLDSALGWALVSILRSMTPALMHWTPSDELRCQLTAPLRHLTERPGINRAPTGATGPRGWFKPAAKTDRKRHGREGRRPVHRGA